MNSKFIDVSDVSSGVYVHVRYVFSRDMTQRSQTFNIYLLKSPWLKMSIFRITLIL